MLELVAQRRRANLKRVGTCGTEPVDYLRHARLEGLAPSACHIPHGPAPRLEREVRARSQVTYLCDIAAGIGDPEGVRLIRRINMDLHRDGYTHIARWDPLCHLDGRPPFEARGDLRGGRGVSWLASGVTGELRGVELGAVVDESTVVGAEGVVCVPSASSPAPCGGLSGVSGPSSSGSDMPVPKAMSPVTSAMKANTATAAAMTAVHLSADICSSESIVASHHTRPVLGHDDRSVNLRLASRVRDPL